MERARTIGIIGCGAIGSYLASFIDERIDARRARLKLVFDVDAAKARTLAERTRHARCARTLGDLMQRSDIIIEAASADALEEIVAKIPSRRKELIVLSAGGLLKRPHLLKKLKSRKVRVSIPSGAIAGIDGLLAASLDGIEYLSLTTRKPPASLQNAPYVQAKQISLEGIESEKTIFVGSPEEAVAGFPQNINVAATVYFASQAKEMIVRVIASAKVKNNVHEIEAHGAFGKIYARVENATFERNPKTSKLAALSAAQLLLKKFQPVCIGT